MSTPDRNIHLSGIAKLQIALDVSEGMRFLHDSQVIHRDLKSKYVLVDSHHRAKITGLGCGDSQWSETTTRTHNCHDNVRAFGVILWELITGKVPWTNTSTLQSSGTSKKKKNANNTQLQKKLKLTESESKTCPSALVTLMYKCCELEEDKNEVSFDFLYNRLVDILQEERKRLTDRENTIPDGFICPITQDVMQDPVMLIDGHSYERKHILDWLKRSNRSPLTNEELPTMNHSGTIVMDNYALKAVIEHYHTMKPRTKVDSIR